MLELKESNFAECLALEKRFREAQVPLFLASRFKVPEHNRNATIIIKYSCGVQGVEAVRSGRVDVRPPFPTLGSLDEEFGEGHIEAAPELNYQPDRRRWRYVWLLIPIAASAVTLAVIWPNYALRLWASAQSLIGSSVEQNTSGSTEGSLGLLTALRTLKDEISELRYGQQKISAEITALRSAQQELQLSSVKAIYWYSEPNALLHQQVASKPTAAAVRNNKPSAQPRPLQEVNAEPRNGTVPLPLARSQTTAPDAVPIR